MSKDRDIQEEIYDVCQRGPATPAPPQARQETREEFWRRMENKVKAMEECLTPDPPQAQEGELALLKIWLEAMAKKGGKGSVDNVDARALGRVAALIARLEKDRAGLMEALELPRRYMKIYERVHDELDEGKPWEEIDIGWRDGRRAPYENWLGYMQGSLINQLKNVLLAAALAGEGKISDP